MTNFYVQLSYEQYKRLEEYLKDFANGDVMLESHGPLVRP